MTNEVTEEIKELKSIVLKIEQLIENEGFDIRLPEHKKLWKKMGELAFKLHPIIKPKHHKYMYENRGVPPEDPEFYNHLHPVQDLLKFIENPDANNDPEDITMGEEFTLSVFSNRWGHDDTYRIKRIKTGWHISYIAIYGDCDTSGHPYLFSNLKQDYINYPVGLGSFMTWLWEKAANEGLNKEEIQEKFNQLGYWISLCEKNTPKWEGYNA